VIAVSRRRRERQRAARGATTGWRPRERLSAARRGATEMAKTAKKIVFSRSRDIPFNKLVLSASNVRRIANGSREDMIAWWRARERRAL
jgi:hypothetical protein